MAVETTGTVHMKGDSGQGVAVSVLFDDTRLRLISGNELIGEWETGGLGITALNRGFAIRAEGEEFVLVTKDDVAIAETLGMASSSPRLARKIAASHPPEERIPEPEPIPPRSRLGAVVFAVAGVLVLAGGFVLRSASPEALATGDLGSVDGPGQFWIAFVIGGLMMAAVAYILALGTPWARVAAILALLGLVIVFIQSTRSATVDATELLAYGFIAGGLVVGVAVVFSGGMTGSD